MTFTEDFLSYVWKHQRFSEISLQAIKGELVSVVKPGVLNNHDGPDFLQAEIDVDGRKWHGSVELHLKSSDWLKHGHEGDPKYKNVILHVVWEHDCEIPSLENVPTIECKNIVHPSTLSKYQSLLQPYQNIPCEKDFESVDEFLRSSWLNRMLVERLETKTRAIQKDYMNLGSNLNQSFYRLMAKGFGQKVNEAGFDQLSRKLPVKILLRYSNSLPNLEALLFGVAGFLNDPLDSYMRDLNERYIHLKRKYDLQEIEPSTWNFMRLRPANFPTVRLAQLAALFFKASDFLQLPNTSPDFAQLQKLLKVKASSYWDNHYRFGKESEISQKWISKGFFEHLVINVFVPFVFYYSRRTGASSFEWVEEVLSNISPENNKIIRKMTAAGFKNSSADLSQAIYHLFQTYCSQSKCLSCALGNAVLKQ